MSVQCGPIRRVDRVVIAPLIFEKVGSVPGLGMFEGRDPGIERTRFRHGCRRYADWVGGLRGHRL